MIPLKINGIQSPFQIKFKGLQREIIPPHRIKALGRLRKGFVGSEKCLRRNE